MQSLGSIVLTAVLNGFFQSLFGGVFNIVTRPVIQKLEATGFFNLNAMDIIGQYGEDLVEKAKEKNWELIAGRDKEISELIGYLRAGKNPCVVGEAGVGKTALVEGLAAKIAVGDVPEDVKKWKIIKVDFPSLVVGKGYGGSSEDWLIRLRALFEWTMKHPETVIFIDEVHQFAKAADLCKTFLDRSQLKLVGATTTREFEEYMAKDPALERRFTLIKVGQPDSVSAFLMTKSRVPGLEKKYNVTISQEVLETNVNLVREYLPLKSSPDKEIRNLEVACELASRSRYELSDDEKTKLAEQISSQLEESREKEGKWNKLKKKLGSLFKEKPKTELATTEEQMVMREPVVLTEDHLRSALQSLTGVPMTPPADEEIERFREFYLTLSSYLSGQEQPVREVWKTFVDLRFGKRQKKLGVMAAFLFAGPSGVGKATVVEAVKDGLHTGMTIDIPATQFKGKLRDRILKTVDAYPHTLIVFRGLDRASDKIRSEISSIISQGYDYDDCDGKRISFKNAVIISTVNTGDVSGRDSAEIKEYLREKLGHDILGKVGRLLVFKSLDKNVAEEKSRDMLTKICLVLREATSAEVEFEESLIDRLTEIASSTSEGMRGWLSYMESLQSILNDIYEVRGELKGKKLVFVAGEDGVELRIENLPEIIAASGDVAKEIEESGFPDEQQVDKDSKETTDENPSDGKIEEKVDVTDAGKVKEDVVA